MMDIIIRDYRCIYIDGKENMFVSTSTTASTIISRFCADLPWLQLKCCSICNILEAHVLLRAKPKMNILQHNDHVGRRKTLTLYQ